MYALAWLMLMAPLIVLMCAITGVAALVFFLFGWQALLAVSLLFAAALWTFAR